jgi:DUF4097 and DUF4098 domain-containing protein YvlB
MSARDDRRFARDDAPGAGDDGGVRVKQLLALAFAVAVIAGSAGFASAQQLEEKSTDRKTFTGARELIIDNITGFIEVTASTGSTVEVEIEKSLKARSQDRMDLAKREISLAVKQDGGLVQLLVDGPFRCHCADNSTNFHGGLPYDFSYNFKVRVPRDIYLELKTVNDSHVLVEGTTGDYKISNVNGGIEMREVEGSGSVHTVNGKVTVSFARNPKAATSFKSVNGTLDVTFRGGLNADAKMKTMNGGLYTDFPVTALPVSSVQPERRDGGFVWKSNRMTGVRIGSGGPELSFETLNGNVLIKNREK